MVSYLTIEPPQVSPYLLAKKQQCTYVGLFLRPLSLILAINVQNYFQLISSYKIPMQKEKTLTQILV